VQPVWPGDNDLLMQLLHFSAAGLGSQIGPANEAGPAFDGAMPTSEPLAAPLSSLSGEPCDL
jgi:hypothetical protein